MSIYLQMIRDDMKKQNEGAMVSEVSELREWCSEMGDDEFMRKLIQTAIHYTSKTYWHEKEVEKLQREVAELRRINEALRLKYNIPYKEVLSERAKSIPTAKKAVSKEMVKKMKASGMTDKKICEKLNISKSTLWRKRKQWEEEEQKEKERQNEEIKNFRLTGLCL